MTIFLEQDSIILFFFWGSWNMWIILFIGSINLYNINRKKKKGIDWKRFWRKIKEDWSNLEVNKGFIWMEGFGEKSIKEYSIRLQYNFAWREELGILKIVSIKRVVETQKTVIGYVFFFFWNGSQNALLLMSFLSMLHYYSRSLTKLLQTSISSAHVML